MSYTLNIEPGIVEEAESCAVRNGTTVDAMIRACLLVFISQGKEGSPLKSAERIMPAPKDHVLQIGSMKDEINMPERFDEVFDSLDQDVVSLFCGSPA